MTSDMTRSKCRNIKPIVTFVTNRNFLNNFVANKSRCTTKIATSTFQSKTVDEMTVSFPRVHELEEKRDN